MDCVKTFADETDEKLPVFLAGKISHNKSKKRNKTEEKLKTSGKRFRNEKMSKNDSAKSVVCKLDERECFTKNREVSNGGNFAPTEKSFRKSDAPFPTLKNTVEDEWRCIYCRKDFGTSRCLTRHMKQSHGDKLEPIKKLLYGDSPSSEKQYCKVCGTALVSLANLVNHTLKVHGKNITCDNNDLVKDARSCSICQKVCKGKQGLRFHLYWSHGNHDNMESEEVFKKFVDKQLSSQSTDLPTMVTLAKPGLNQSPENLKNRIQELLEKDSKNSSSAQKPPVKPVKKFAKIKDTSIHECNECTLTFASAPMVDLHKNLRHVLHQCHQCSALCNGRLALNAHFKLAHETV